MIENLIKDIKETKDLKESFNKNENKSNDLLEKRKLAEQIFREYNTYGDDSKDESVIKIQEEIDKLLEENKIIRKEIEEKISVFKEQTIELLEKQKDIIFENKDKSEEEKQEKINLLEEKQKDLLNKKELAEESISKLKNRLENDVFKNMADISIKIHENNIEKYKEEYEKNSLEIKGLEVNNSLTELKEINNKIKTIEKCNFDNVQDINENEIDMLESNQAETQTQVQTEAQAQVNVQDINENEIDMLESNQVQTEAPNPNLNQAKKQNHIKDIHVVLKDNTAYVTFEDGKIANKSIDFMEKNKLYKNIHIKNIIKDILGTKNILKIFNLQRKLDPTIISILNENGKKPAINNYILSMYKKDGLNFNLSYDVNTTSEELSKVDKAVIKKARHADKINGVDVKGLNEKKGLFSIFNKPKTLNVGKDEQNKFKDPEAEELYQHYEDYHNDKGFNINRFYKDLENRGLSKEIIGNIRETIERNEKIEKTMEIKNKSFVEKVENKDGSIEKQAQNNIEKKSSEQKRTRDNFDIDVPIK